MLHFESQMHSILEVNVQDICIASLLPAGNPPWGTEADYLRAIFIVL